MSVKFDPNIHHRRSIRLQGYDYAQPGAYYVTVVTHQRELLFDDPVLHKVAETMWLRIPRRFHSVRLGEWVVMPNHIHGVLWIVELNEVAGARHSRKISDKVRTDEDVEHELNTERNGNASPLRELPNGLKPGSLGAIVGNYKSVTARRINKIRKTAGARVWQRNYYDHIVRDEEDLMRIRQYIRDNPIRWEEDQENPIHW